MIHKDKSYISQKIKEYNIPLRNPHESSCYIDLTNLKFGRWTVLNKVEIKGSNGARWLCQCDCGTKKTVRGHDLRYGISTSCGCYNLELKSKPNGVTASNNIYNSYIKSAKRRKKIFELTKNDFIKLTQQDCYYCGCKPSAIAKSGESTGEFIYNGIDRIDNEQGYTKENTVTCCKWCNQMKLYYGQQEFLDHVKQIAEHQKLFEKEK